MTGSMRQVTGRLATSPPSWIVTDGVVSWNVWHLEPSLHLVLLVTEEPSGSPSLWMGAGGESISVTALTSRRGSQKRCRQCEQLWDSLLPLPPDADLVHGAPKASSRP